MTAGPRGYSGAADSQPAGELTFAFTDIEGSTPRWERNHAEMQDAVARHDAILRGSIEQHGGRVFKTIGDAFCGVFALPQEAVAAMLAAQQALRAEDFSSVDGLRVRAAIHTGSAEVRGGDYFGPALNKVARLLAIGHGGQVLMTAEVAALVDGTLPAGVSLRELGAYHLKDSTEPQRLYQLMAPGAETEYAPLRSLGTLPSDLSIVDVAEFHSVPSFSGRDDELAAVDAALRDDGAVAVVHGLGGVGKSSIAREYGWRNREHYSVVWWLNAQTEDGIIDGLLRLGTMFVQGLAQLADRRVAGQRVINSVLGGFDKPVLLVFDNLEDEALLRTWLPRTGARALATSRDTALSSDVITIPLQTWSLETAVAYLQRASRRTDVNEADARAIAEELGALPLALAHAAASLRSARMVSPQRYLERVRTHLKNAPRGAEYPRSVFATFSAAIAQAEQQVAGAAAVLCFAASFSPDAIPDELFHQPIENYTVSELRSAIVDEMDLDETLGALDRLSLLKFAEGSRSYTIHRLVQFAAQDLIGEAERAWSECAVNVANAAFPAVDFGSWPQCERLLAHSRAALNALPRDDELLPAAELAFRCGRYLRERGEYRASEQLQARALAIREKLFGPDHPDVSDGLTNLGIALGEQGRLVEAVPLFERALEIREKALGPEGPSVAGALLNLAHGYHEQGRFSEAEALNKRALAIFENSRGPDHGDTAFAIINLAHDYMRQGRYAEAEPLQERALAIREKVLRPDHPDVSVSLNNLADVYRCQGRYAEADPLLTRALAIREKALGTDHPSVANVLDTLANLYRGQSRQADAERIYQRALQIREKALGPDHPLTTATREALNAAVSP
ncbi:MAG: FxSxx-COOH system tetratricopeptide repeat protein [Candidatus Cybelea sp.]